MVFVKFGIFFIIAKSYKAIYALCAFAFNMDFGTLSSESLRNELATCKDAATQKVQRVKYVKAQVTYYWQAYQADVRDTATKTDLVEIITSQQRDVTANTLYQNWLDDFQKESDELTQQQQHVIELQTSLYQKYNVLDSDGIGGIDPATDLPMKHQ